MVDRPQHVDGLDLDASGLDRDCIHSVCGIATGILNAVDCANAARLFGWA
jgi:hypothetical protein